MKENEIKCANDLADCLEIADLEIEVIDAADCDSAGYAGCFLVPILILLFVFTGALPALESPVSLLKIIFVRRID